MPMPDKPGKLNILHPTAIESIPSQLDDSTVKRKEVPSEIADRSFGLSFEEMPRSWVILACSVVSRDVAVFDRPFDPLELHHADDCSNQGQARAHERHSLCGHARLSKREEEDT